MNVRSFLMFLGLSFTNYATGVAAEESPRYQSIEALQTAVTEHVKTYFLQAQPNLIYGEDFFVEVGHLDSRLQLASCDNSLTFKLNKPPQSADRVTVRTSCSTGAKWTIYVPATIEIFDNVVVTARDIPKNTVLGKDDLTFMRLNTARLGIGLIQDIRSLEGMELTRPMRAGSPINQSQVRQPDLIAKGDSVVLQSKSPVLSVETNGTALDHGHLGQQIRVRNNQSQRIVDGMVVAPGVVRVAAQ